MLSVIKQIIACLVIASLVAAACYFLPFINSLFGDYLIGFFLAAFLFPIGMKCYEAHMVKVRALPKSVREKREKECKEWHKEDSEAMTCSTRAYDLRNVDQRHHIFNGYKD